MNRIIKFRVWTGKQMLYQDEQYLASFIRRAVLQINLDNERGFQQAHESYLPDGKSIDDYLMQFTGLTDCHDKEIYEGDVIRWKIWPSSVEDENDTIEKYVVDAVTMLRGCFHAVRRIQIIGTIEPYRRLEVIGNLYENADLLPQKEG
jgi:uncharacterized phage protein (TIGR01671 family)